NRPKKNSKATIQSAALLSHYGVSGLWRFGKELRRATNPLNPARRQNSIGRLPAPVDKWMNSNFEGMRSLTMTREFKRPERIRLGVIGCGPITLNAHADAIAKTGNILLHAIAERDETLLADMSRRLRPARTYRDGEELLNDPRVDL